MLEPTSSPAPPSRYVAALPPTQPTEEAEEPIAESPTPAHVPARADRDVYATGGTATGLAKTALPPRKRFPHRGFTADFRFGTQGCVRAICSPGRHAAKPGVRLDGFVGGNIRGFVELGLSGGWGTFGTDVADGTNALELYGVNPRDLERAIAAAGGGLAFDLDSLRVRDAKLRTAQAGPMLRVHFIPRGRFAAWVGTGVGYSLFRADYETDGGGVRLDLHGLDVPIEGGFAVYVHENVAVGAQFDYLWTWYGLASVDHPQQRATLPIEVLDGVAAERGVDLSGSLPQFWTFGLALRARL